MKRFFNVLIKTIPVSYNLVRDIIWASFCFGYADRHAGNPSETESQLLQWALPTIGMFIVLKMQSDISRRLFATRTGEQKSAISLVAASVAIPLWNQASVLGKKFYESRGWSPTMAGYLSAPFCGLAEGPTQELITVLFSVLFNDQERKSLQENPNIYFKNFLAKMGFSVTLGIIPGAVWQLISQACATHDVNVGVSVIAVAFGVAASNLGYLYMQGKMIDFINAPEEEKSAGPEEEKIIFVESPYILWSASQSYSINTLSTNQSSRLSESHF